MNRVVRKKAPVGGFTLIELIVVVVILAIGTVAVISMVANANMFQTGNRNLQVGTQLVQQCGEYVLAKHRREQTYFSTLASSTTCYATPAGFGGTFEGYNGPDVTVAPYTSSGCPALATCKLVTITLSKTGAALSPVNLILVQY